MSDCGSGGGVASVDTRSHVSRYLLHQTDSKSNPIFYRFKMVICRAHQITLCSCGQVFQADNYKRHRASKKIKGDGDHTKKERILYCVKCGEFGEGHNKCPYFTLTKAEMTQLLTSKPLKNTKEVIERADVKKKKMEMAAAKRAEVEKESATPMDIIERAVEAAALNEAIASISPPVPPPPPPPPAENITMDDDDEEIFQDWPMGEVSPSSQAPFIASSPIPERTSSTPYDPRSEAVPCTSRVAMSTMVDKVERHKKLQQAAEERSAQAEMRRAKAVEDLEKEREKARSMEQKLKDAMETIEKERRLKNEVEEKLKAERKEKEKVMEKLKEAEKTEKKEKWWLVHLACQNGRIVERFWEDPDQLEKTTICFSDQSKNIHCHHIRLCTFSKIGVFIQNTKWQSK